MDNDSLHIQQHKQLAEAGIYIHIPFCKQACTYCNFHFSTNLGTASKVLQAIKLELTDRKSYLDNHLIRSIYFGGGTPSLLPIGEINAIVDLIRSNYQVDSKAEITLEANPDDLTRDYVDQLSSSSKINRLSIGIQSFVERDLRFMNRAHSSEEALRCVQICREHDITNLSIDLIFGTPGLTDAEWQNNLQIAAELGVPHFSAYALTLEEKTKYHHLVTKTGASEPDMEQAARQFEMLMDLAEASGYEHYEISNFATPGQYARHNTNYWTGRHYLGIGPSAHSFNTATRSWNVANNAMYASKILAGETAQTVEVLTTIQALNEYIMTSLRTQWGCNLQYVEQTFGSAARRQLTALSKSSINKGLIVLAGSVLQLTRKGKLFADGIAADLFF